MKKLAKALPLYLVSMSCTHKNRHFSISSQLPDGDFFSGENSVCPELLQKLGAGFLELFKPLQESLYIVFLQVVRR